MRMFVSLVVLLGCCVVSEVQAAPPAKERARIGFILPLSGQYAAVGADNQQGMEIAKEELAHPEYIDFLLADSKADPTQAVSEFKKLVDSDKIAGAFVFRGPPGMAINPISKEFGVPILGGVGNKDFALQNKYAFQLWVPSDEEGTFLAERVAEMGYRRVALLTVQDDWTVAVSAGFRSRLRTLGVSLVFEQDVLPGEVDFKTTISKLKPVLPEVIFVNLGLNQIAPFARQLRELKVEARLFSNFWAGKKEVLAALGQGAEGLCFAELSTDLEKLKSALKRRFDSSPSGATLSSYIGTILLAQAVDALNGATLTKESLYASLLQQKRVHTLNGDFEIGNRVVQFPMVIREIRGGKPQPLNLAR